jgi:hypothetical protein
MTTTTDISREMGMRAYLQSRFYPPLPEGYVGPALEAIDLCNAGDYSAYVSLPSDINPQPREVEEDGEGNLVVEAAHLVGILRLEHVIENDEEDWED